MTAPPAVCCGERPPGVAGEPEVVACKLCPKSGKYWRAGRTLPVEPWPSENAPPVPEATPEPARDAEAPTAPPWTATNEDGELW